MEIKLSKSNLLRGITLVGNVTAQKAATLPILGNMLFEASKKEDCLKIIGTDLEVGISTTVPAEIQKEGAITIPAKKISEIVRELPEGEIEITVAKNNAVNIKAGKAFFKVMGLMKEDYPKLPEWNNENAIELDQALLKECLALTSFAISYDETRYVLNGVLVSVTDKLIRFVATDGRRLACSEKEIENKDGQTFEMIVPVKAVQELLKMLTWEGTVKMIPSQNQVVFVLGDTFLVSRLIEGHFPNYEQVIPKGKKTTSSANREDFLRVVRRTALLTSADSPAIKMDFVKGKILLSSRSPNMGEAKEELKADVSGNDLVIGFNPQYLIDVLKNLDVENVSFSLTDPDKPGLIQGKDGYRYVIMPMQLN
ncbi:MAG: DNA polymerase III subunit beta [Candidatus Omnitrophica bacterium]|nr:DNA polymerase III subunit beta [Candidatus Omnitrophota bacterium]